MSIFAWSGAAIVRSFVSGNGGLTSNKIQNCFANTKPLASLIGHSTTWHTGHRFLLVFLTVFPQLQKTTLINGDAFKGSSSRILGDTAPINWDTFGCTFSCTFCESCCYSHVLDHTRDFKRQPKLMGTPWGVDLLREFCRYSSNEFVVTPSGVVFSHLLVYVVVIHTAVSSTSKRRTVSETDLRQL